MTIEYLPGVAVGGKIDLDQFKSNKKEKSLNPEINLRNLKVSLESLSQEANQAFSNFLEADGRIAIIGRDADQDQKLVDSQEEGFSQNQGKSLKQWQGDTEKNPANLTEMALTITLHKFLKNDFIVARASRYDDYNNGVDQVIVDKKTGDVICGFDEVFTSGFDGGGEKKVEKMKKIKEKGGAEIKYGATLENDQLVRSHIKNVPAFYLALSKDELKELLEVLANKNTVITEVEINIFNKLLDSLETQASQDQDNWALKAKSQMALDRLRNAFEQKIAA